MDNIKLLICSSASMPVSGLNLGSHFSGWAGNWLKGAGIKTAPGLFHGIWAIAELLTEESAEDDICDWEDEDIMIWERDVEDWVDWWTVSWSGEVGGWLRDEVFEMDDDDERVSLLDPLGDFLALFLVGRGNSVGWMLIFSLCNLVRGWAGLYCEVTLPWDLSDLWGDIKNRWIFWIKDLNSGGSIADSSEKSGFVAVVVVLSTSGSRFKDSKCDGEVGGDGEGDLL